MKTLCVSCADNVKQKNWLFSKLCQMDVLALQRPGTRVIPHTQDTHELHYEVLAPCLISMVIFNPKERDLDVRICNDEHGIKTEIEQIKILRSCYHSMYLYVASNRSTQVWLNDHFLRFRPV